MEAVLQSIVSQQQIGVSLPAYQKTLTVTFVVLEHCANATKNIPIVLNILKVESENDTLKNGTENFTKLFQ